MKILIRMVTLCCISFISFADIIAHWRFENGAFLEDSSLYNRGGPVNVASGIKV